MHEYQVLPIALGEPAVESTEDEDDEPVEPGPDTPLHLATAWLPDDVMSDWIHTFTPRPVVWHLAVAERVHQLIVEHFGVGAASLDDGDDDYLSPEAAEADAEIVDEDAAVVRFVTEVISQAIADEATDIHFEPQGRTVADSLSRRRPVGARARAGESPALPRRHHIPR